MDPTVQRSTPIKAIVIIASVLVVVLLAITMLVAGRRSNSSATNTPTPTLSESSGGTSGGTSRGVTPKVSIAFPKSYNSTAIPSSIYTQGQTEYNKIPTSQSDSYVATTVRNYYMYADALKENKYIVPATPTDFKTMELQVPQLQSRVEAALLSSASFAYIKARYRFHPHASFVEYKFGDLKAKANAKIMYYKDLLTAGQLSPEAIVAMSNNDEELMLLNNYEKNEVRTDYTAESGLFFTDKNFHDFLFNQKANTVSEIYTLRSSDNSEYAYLIVFPNQVIERKYRTIEQLIADKSKNFK